MGNKTKNLILADKISQDIDLNHQIIKDKHGKEFFRKGVFSHIVITFFLIAIQISVFCLFLLRLSPYIEYYFGGSIVISTSFMIYLSNCKGKNEFKLAWLVPTVIFPLFGVSAYILYHTNVGGKKVGKRLAYLKKKTEKNIESISQVQNILSNYSDIAGLAYFLATQGNYYPHTNSKVDYYPNGELFFSEFINAIKNAKEFIFLEFFIIDIDESWDLLLAELKRKVQEGVEVRVLYDGIGSPMASTKVYQKYLNEIGIKAHIFLPLVPFFSTQQNSRDHRKIAIIDGKIAFTGGLNLSNEYFNYGKNRFNYWKDNAIRIEGSAIRNLTIMFLQTWNIQTRGDDNYSKYIDVSYETYNSKGLIIPYGDDAYNNEDIAEEVYNYILSNSKKYVHITTPYMIVDNELLDSLIFASQRGVDVSIIIPSKPDHFMTFCIGKTYIKTLVEKGVHVYLYKKGFIHAKTFISDDIISTVGSVNLDYRSLFHHFECGTVLYDKEITSKIENDFQETLLDCDEMKIEDYKKIPPHIRIIGRFFRIFSPLL